MKITNITSEVFEWERPGIWNGGHFYGPGRLHKVTVHTDEGITGYGWNGGTAAERPLNLFPGYVDYFRPLVVGRDPMDTRALSYDLGEKLIKILGIGGINTQVLAAINIACWDIKGKATCQSIHRLLGGAQERIRTYIAGGYYAEGKGLEELQEEVRFNVEDMHASAVKIKIGDPNVGVAGDMRRVEAARKAIGDDATLLVDANCALDLETSLEFARQLPQYDVYWFEEPLPIHDYEGHGQLAEASSVKIATGENGYHLAHFKTLLDHNGASILNVDVGIVPGYDVAMDIADLAAERGVSIAPHGCQELQLPLAAAIPHGEFLEIYPVAVDPLRAEMFQPLLQPDDDGFVTVPDRPGIGYELNMDLLNRYRVG
ncbi:MAG: mandelate racemase/muconate lactonizing enzyme family protein [Chloroflexota bacterium]|nr:mandelate racemase/muconate lactonizing enzyme family protein [Chloroflexota bacterium]